MRVVAGGVAPVRGDLQGGERGGVRVCLRAEGHGVWGCPCDAGVWHVHDPAKPWEGDAGVFAGGEDPGAHGGGEEAKPGADELPEPVLGVRERGECVARGTGGDGSRGAWGGCAAVRHHGSALEQRRGGEPHAGDDL